MTAPLTTAKIKTQYRMNNPAIPQYARYTEIALGLRLNEPDALLHRVVALGDTIALSGSSPTAARALTRERGLGWA